jgi:hypothetical protein
MGTACGSRAGRRAANTVPPLDAMTTPDRLALEAWAAWMGDANGEGTIGIGALLKRTSVGLFALAAQPGVHARVLL